MSGALTGIVLVCVGLWLAVLSNPRRFSLNVAEDRQIHLLAGAAFLSTISGIVLLVAAVRHTTVEMSPQHRTTANRGVGLGFVLQLAAGLVAQTGHIDPLVSAVLFLGSLPLMIWGCINYAAGKGYPKWLGLAGAASIVGLTLLNVLPAQNEPQH